MAFASLVFRPAGRAAMPRVGGVLHQAGKATLIPLVFAAAAGMSAAAQAQNAAPPPSHVMTLQASATAEVTMDTLGIVFSTTKDGSDAAAVQAQLKQALDAALAEARKIARPGQVEVRTGNFSLMPRHAPKGGISGWQGSAQLMVEGKDMAAIAQLAGRIQTLSIARVGHSLSREAREKLETETTAQAIARWRERAQAQAQLFGYTGYVVREVQVNSDGGGGPVPMVAMRARAPGMGEDMALPIEAGKASVTSNVSGSVQMTR